MIVSSLLVILMSFVMLWQGYQGVVMGFIAAFFFNIIAMFPLALVFNISLDDSKGIILLAVMGVISFLSTLKICSLVMKKKGLSL